jgi:hypothetical protein
MKKITIPTISFVAIILASCVPAKLIPTETPIPPLTFTPISPIRTITPTPTPHPLHQPELISSEKLECSSLGAFTKCIDDVLAIEFEYPTAWGEIEAELRTGGYSGYAYDYYFGGKTIAESEPLVAGGRSKDFSEGRGGVSTDFAGYGDKGLQFKKGACDSNWKDSFPICQTVTNDVAWMIQFPNARYICNSAPGFYTKPVFRIEINLPNNPTINGFIFEAPSFSEQFSNEVKNDLYPLLGLGLDMVPTKCSEADQKAFDAKLKILLENISTKAIDGETQRKLDELMHLVNSIHLR